MLPPVLRGRLLVALLGVAIQPIREVYWKFEELRESVDKRLGTTGNVVCLEKALNDAFFLCDRQIYIETPEGEPSRVLHLKLEIQNDAPLLKMKEEADGEYHVWQKGESQTNINFVIKVPTFLCSSLDVAEDVHGGCHLGVIMRILNIYKPAGRTYSIELYDYE